MKGSFFTPLEEAKNFFKESVMYDQEGIYVSWLTTPQVIQRILPPPMEPLAPIIFAYIINIQKPTFCSRYNEAAAAIPCFCNGVKGVYWISFMLSGPGREMGTFGGREVAGIPKKIADEIIVKRMGRYAKGTLIRHGINLFEVEMDICGHYNNAAAYNVLGDPKPGDEQLLDGFFYKFDVNKGAEGIVKFEDANIVDCAFAMQYHGFEKGTATVKLGESFEDPWDELEVVEVLGAAWIKNDIDLAWSKSLGTIEADTIIPYLMSARYDKGTMNQGEVVFQ